MNTNTNRPRLSVVVPVYNERATIEEILWRVQAVNIEKEIIIVDDGSTDGTREFLQELASAKRDDQERRTLPQTGRVLSVENIHFYFQKKNFGKGAAVRAGFQEARGEIVLVQDADLEYDPQEYPNLLMPIELGRADVVYGSRFLGGKTQRVFFFWHSVGNRLLTMLSNMCTDLNLTDVWTCYKVFRREVLEHIDLREDGFGFEPEITAKVRKGPWRIYEVPISYWGRDYAEGKKISWKDGFSGVWCILRYNLFN